MAAESLAVDETAGDLPVRDVGLRPGPGAVLHGTRQEEKPWRRQHIRKSRDRQRLSRVSREELEDRCLRLQEENQLLRQHSREQEQRIRRMSTKLLRLSAGRRGGIGGHGAELEETIQELQDRISTLESQKEALRSKLSLATEQNLTLRGRTGHSYCRHSGQPERERGVRGQDCDPAVRRSAQTAPARFGLNALEETRGERDRLAGLRDSQRSRMAEVEQTAELLRDTLRAKELEIEETLRELRSQQAEGHRVTIRENVDAIRLQKQLSEKSAALLAMQEKYSSLQEAFETQLEESQRALRQSHQALLEKAEEVTEQLKQERQRASSLERALNTATLSRQGLEEMQTRLEEVQGERDLLKESYDKLLESSLAVPQPGDGQGQQVLRLHLQALQESLRQEEQDRETAEQRAARDRDTLTSLRETHATLQQEVLRRTEEVTSLQDQLDSVTKEFNMSVEELSETLLQIKMFRLQREGEEKLRFLRKETPGDCGNTEHHQLLDLQATQAETVLELQKTRELLLLQHRITADTQNELQTVMKRAEKEREESRRSLEERDRLLEQRAQRISTLQGGGGRVTLEPPEEDAIVSWRQEGESLLEVHVAGATFTPAGLRAVGGEAVTFCTYAFRDFETHATPLASGPRPAYGFTSRYPVSRGDLSPQGAAEGGGVRVELHQSLGGVRFVTRGRGVIPLTGALRRGGERVPGTANLTGPDGEILGVLDFWVRLWPPLEGAEGPRDPGYLSYHTLGWPDSGPQELFDFSGGGIPNELEVVMEHCHGLSARWPGLLPDAYLMYRLYDLPPHTSPIIPCCADPVFHDRARFPLAVTPDLCRYLQGACLWVYAFDDGDGPPPPPAYLGKTPIPLRPLAAGRPVRGDFVLRDAGGQPRGTLRVSLRWQYPFQPPGAPPGHRAAAAAGTGGLERAGPEQTPVAKPRMKLASGSSQMQPERRQTQTQEVAEVEQEVAEVEQEVAEEAAMEEEAAQEQEVEAEHSGRSQEAGSERAQLDSDVTTESGESQPSTDSDVIIIPRPLMPAKKAEKLRVEILSLTFDPTSRVALDQSVQRIYVEYRLLGVPMETTETPMSLRKPAAGEEIHYNFTRVIHVDRVQDAALRQYLYTMLEGTDPNQGRLKFTVVSEPMDEQEEECVDVGHAHLDLQEVLLTGSDVVERQIDIVSVDEQKEVVGKLKVSLEAAQTLTGIYWEYKKQEEAEEEEEEFGNGRAEEDGKEDF